MYAIRSYYAAEEWNIITWSFWFTKTFPAIIPGELEAIRHRVELVKRGLELRYAGKKIDYLLEKGRRRFQEQAAASKIATSIMRSTRCRLSRRFSW